MENIDLNAFNVQELSCDELSSTFGGGPWQDFKEGFVEGFNWMREFMTDFIGIFGKKK